VLHAKPFLSITTEDMQKVIDDCEKSHATKEHIVNLFKQIYDYADSQDLCDKKYSDYVKINTPDDDEKGVPFTESEIDTIWEHKDDAEIYKFILIMIYTGMRIAEYKNVKINTEKKCFIGGVKTDASKNRIVPLSPLILGFVSAKSEFYTTRTNTLRIWITSALNDIGIKNHTPHDCRHTFSWLCDKYGVDSLSKKMILGHTLGDSVTDTVYGHRTFEELYTEVCKIKHW
jgi:integrase